MKSIIRVTSMILLTVAFVWMLWLFSSAVLLFLVSLVIASAVRPFALRLMERGLNRATAYTLVFVFVLLFLGILIGVIFGNILDELQQAGDGLLNFYTRVKTEWPQGQSWQQSISSGLPEREDLIKYLTGENGRAIINTVVGFGSGIVGALAQVIILISLSTYWAIDRTRFERLWLSLISAKRRSRARDIWHTIEDEVGAYVRSELIQSVFAAILLGLAFRFMGLPYPTLLGIWAGLTWLVPWVGVVLAVIPAIIIGSQVSIPLAILATLVTITVFAVFEIWVEPRLYGRNRVSPVLVVVTMMIMAGYLGIFGLLIAPPLAATLQILGRELLTKSGGETVEVTARQQLRVLRERLHYLRTHDQHEEIASLPQRMSLINNLEGLIEDTATILRRDKTAAQQTITTTTDEVSVSSPLPS